MKLNNSVYLLCTLHVKNQQLTSNWLISLSYYLTPGPCMASCAWLDYRIRKLLDWSSDWLYAASAGMISVECCLKNFNSYVQI